MAGVTAAIMAAMLVMEGIRMVKNRGDRHQKAKNRVQGANEARSARSQERDARGMLIQHERKKKLRRSQTKYTDAITEALMAGTTQDMAGGAGSVQDLIARSMGGGR